jgi:DNA-binding NtrC family response regulator
LHVESTPGVGTTFHVYFPALSGAAAQAAARYTPAAGMAARSAASVPSDRRVLYVDDDEMLVSLVTRLLKRSGCEVTGYGLAAEALEAFRSTPEAFDVVITDFNMPEMSGLEVARQVLALRPAMPVVITSGYITTELQAEAERIGVPHLLYKPDLAKRLLQLVRSLPLPSHRDTPTRSAERLP